MASWGRCEGQGESAVLRAVRQSHELGHLTGLPRVFNILRLMSANVPEMLDAWRMVAARRRFDGRIPLSAMTRLQGSLVDTDGECVYSLQFDQDPLLKVAYVELSIDVELPLACQRSLQRFLYPVQIRQRLGLIRDEADEAALPAEYEALLVPEDGMLRAVDMIEDELVLSVPVVPVAPGSEAIDAEWVPTQEEQDKASPFAALAALKKQ